MICIKRSVDFHKDVCWVTHSLDEEKRRCSQLYLGTDVNGAIAAAVGAGVTREAAVSMAQTELNRRDVNDNIAQTALPGVN